MSEYLIKLLEQVSSVKMYMAGGVYYLEVRDMDQQWHMFDSISLEGAIMTALEKVK